MFLLLFYYYSLILISFHYVLIITNYISLKKEQRESDVKTRNGDVGPWEKFDVRTRI